MSKPYLILLYYNYVPIEDPETFRINHHRLCADLGLLGRVIIAKEGINGTLSGLEEACMKYVTYFKNMPLLQETVFKITPHHQHAFQKLNVRVKKEIVHANLHHINPRQKTGQYITPQQLEKMYDDPEVVVLDVRSNYEHQLGKLSRAITLDINHFREFPEKIEALAPYKNKKVVTYCTGGVKCEKASAYLLEKGFKNVYQLHGGIIQYGQETNGQYFEGKCYVFDNRIVQDINKNEAKIISKCYLCQQDCDRMVNCANPLCNVHVPICTTCGITYEGACSERCKVHPSKRPYNGTGYYTKQLNGYNPHKAINQSGLNHLQ